MINAVCIFCPLLNSNQSLVIGYRIAVQDSLHYGAGECVRSLMHHCGFQFECAFLPEKKAQHLHRPAGLVHENPRFDVGVAAQPHDWDNPRLIRTHAHIDNLHKLDIKNQKSKWEIIIQNYEFYITGKSSEM